MSAWRRLAPAIAGAAVLAALLALGMAASARAAAAVSIEAPANHGWTNTGEIKGTGTPEVPLTLTIHEGESASGGQVGSAITVTPDEHGQWSTTPSFPQDGTYTAVAEQGESSEASTSEATFTLDTQRPHVTLNTLTSPTRDSPPTLTGAGGEAEGDAPTATVTIYKGTSVGGQEAASATPTVLGGAWTYTPAHLSDGTYTAQAVQRDKAGNIGESAAVTFTIDTVAPALSMETVLSPSKTTTPTLHGALGTAEGDDPSVTVAIYRGSTVEESNKVLSESAAIGSGSWSYTTPSLSDGTYTALARQQDTAENTATVTRTFTIDNTAPAVSLSTPADGAFINSGEPSFAGGAGNASGDSTSVTLHIYEGSSASGPSKDFSLTRSGGSWSWSPSASELSLSDGTYTAVASQTDTAGNDGTSSAHTFTVKTTGPAVTLNPLVSPLPNSTPTFSGGAATGPGDVQTVTVKVYAGESVGPSALRTLVVPAGEGLWSAGPVEALPDGTYTAQAEQKDQAGNTGKSTPMTFRLDTTKPKVAISAMPNPTKGATPTLEGTRGTEAGDDPSVSVTVYEGSPSSGKVVVSQSFGVTGAAWSYTTPHLSDGTYTAQVTQQDAAGNVGETTAAFTVDTTPPQLTLSPIPTPSNVSTPTLRGTGGGEAGDLQTVKVTIYEGTSAEGHEATSGTASVNAGKWSFTTAHLADGTYTALVTESDKAGNTGSSAPQTFTINTAAPTVTLSSPALLSNNTTPSFKGTATDTTQVTVEVFAGSSATGTAVWKTAATGTQQWETGTVAPALTDGQYTVIARQPSSILGNPEGKSTPVTFRVDTKAPTVALNQPTSPSNNMTPSFTGTGSDPSGEVIVKIYAGEKPSGTVVSEATAAGNGGSWTSAPVKHALEAGKHTYTATATQKSSLGNLEGISAPVTFIVDTTAPVVTLTAPKSPSNNPATAFSGTASDTTNVTVQIHEGSSSGPVKATATAPVTAGEWTSAAASPALKSGQYTAVAVQPSSIPGNPEGKSSPVPFTIDTVAPHVTLASLHSPTSSPSPTLTGRAGSEAEDEPTVKLTVYKGASAGGEAEVVFSGAQSQLALGATWSIASSDLEDGTYTAQASESDKAGNTGVSAPVTFTVDTKPPTLSLTAPAEKSNNRSPAFTGTASELTPVTIRVYEGERSTTPIRELRATGTGGEWRSEPVELPLKKTTVLYTVTATQTDEAGNTATTPRARFFVDSEAPTVTLNQPRTPSNNAAPRFAGTASDTTPVTIRIFSAGGEAPREVAKATATGTGGAWTSSSASPALADGRYTAYAIQESAYGNHEGQTATVAFTIDTVPPVVTLTAPRSGSSMSGEALRAEGGADSGEGSLPGVTVQLFSGSSIVAGQAPVASVEVNAVAGRWSAPFAGVPAGIYSVRALQFDDAGNVGASAPSTFTLTDPPAAGASARPAPSASFTWFPATPHVDERVSLVSNSSDPGSALVSFGWDVAGNGAFQPGGAVQTTTFTTPGNHVLHLKVIDAAGLSSVATQTIPVAQQTAALMQPFPLVRLITTRTSTGVRLRLLTVLASVGARISIRCRGHGCPVRSLSRTAASGKAGIASVEFRRFQRSLHAGLILEIRVYRPAEIGKYTRLVIRRGHLRRSDSCLSPSGITPIGCPLP